MPVYEYTCKNCGSLFDKLRPMKEADAPIACKNCQSTDTHRCLSKFFAHSDGKAVAGSSGGCSGGCSNCSGGGSCGSCRH